MSNINFNLNKAILRPELISKGDWEIIENLSQPQLFEMFANYFDWLRCCAVGRMVENSPRHTTERNLRGKFKRRLNITIKKMLSLADMIKPSHFTKDQYTDYSSSVAELLRQRAEIQKPPIVAQSTYTQYPLW